MNTQEIRAAVLHGTGRVPRYETFPAPAAGDGEAVVTVTAAALKPSDRLMAEGVHYAPDTFPQIAGLDGVGRLEDGTRGEPAEAVFEALMRSVSAPGRIRYILVGMMAGEVAGVPAIALRRAPVQLAGSGIGGPAPLEATAVAYADLLQRVVAGEISIDAEAVPLAEVEKTWSRPDDGRRIVFVP
jgi:hypothetical protein